MNTYIRKTIIVAFALLINASYAQNETEKNTDKSFKKTNLDIDIKKVDYHARNSFKVHANNRNKNILDIVALTSNKFLVAAKSGINEITLASFEYNYETNDISRVKKISYSQNDFKNITYVKLVSLGVDRVCVINNCISSKKTHLRVYDVKSSQLIKKSEYTVGNSDSIDASRLNLDSGESAFVLSTYNQSNSNRVKYIIWKVDSSGKLLRQGERQRTVSGTANAVSSLGNNYFVSATKSSSTDDLVTRYWKVEKLNNVLTPVYKDYHKIRVVGGVSDNPNDISIVPINKARFVLSYAKSPLSSKKYNLVYDICDNNKICRSSYEEYDNAVTTDVISLSGFLTGDVQSFLAASARETGGYKLRLFTINATGMTDKIASPGWSNSVYMIKAATIFPAFPILEPYFITAELRTEDDKIRLRAWTVTRE